jgi:hypothetical protein
MRKVIYKEKEGCIIELTEGLTVKYKTCENAQHPRYHELNVRSECKLRIWAAANLGTIDHAAN